MSRIRVTKKNTDDSSAAVSDSDADVRLHRSEERYRRILESISDYVYTVAIKEGTVVSTTHGHACVAVTGYTSEDFARNQFLWINMVHPEDQQAVRAHADAVLTGNAMQTIEHRIIIKNGNVRWIRNTPVPHYDHSGVLISYDGVIHDITDRKQAEKQALLDDSRLESLLALTQRVTGSVQELLEYTLEDAIALTGSKIGYLYEYSESKRQFTLNSWSKNVMAECAVMEKQTVYDLDKTGFWGEAVRQKRAIISNDFKMPDPLKKGYPAGHVELKKFLTVPVLRKGAIVAVVGVANKPEDYDQGDVRQLTLLMDAVWNILERRQLEDSIQNTQRLESLGVLAGGIAHDFNNLLGGIFGYMDMARDYLEKGAADKADKSLVKALNVYNRACNLTQQLLTFSKGGKPVKSVLVISDMIKDTAYFVLSGSNVKLVLDIDPALWPCNVDANQISQVIDNLVINARQAMPTGGTITITGRNLEAVAPPVSWLPAGNYVDICIVDTGTGIPRENIGRVFDPFFTTKAKGSGLGLATSYSIVRRHDGGITVASEPGVGTVFHVYLPAANSTPAPVPELKMRDHTGSGRVLLMDDEPHMTDLLTNLFEAMGYTTVSSPDGNEAIAAFKRARKDNNPFVLAVLDLTIPGGLGGRDTVVQLLKMDPLFKAIAASGYTEDPVMADPAEFGFAAVLRKPFRKYDVNAVVGQLMKPAKTLDDCLPD